MRITCLIDHLNSGGAQRQMCMLASLLKKKGFDVEVITYFDMDFFGYLLKEANVPYRTISWKNKIHRIWAVRRAIQESRPDVVIAYLGTPSLLAELASLPKREFALIVSERSANIQITGRVRLRLFFHRYADAIVPNSYSQQKSIEQAAPYLRTKMTTILNCVDLNHYQPAVTSACENGIKILVVGRFEPPKNPLVMLNAVEMVNKSRPEMNIKVDWYGSSFFVNQKPTPASVLYLQLEQEIQKRSLQSVFRLHSPQRDLVAVYQSASAFCLPSLYEGCSNVIAEAMACGKPILAGRVCDNPILVEDGINGFLFDPRNPKDIVEKILQFTALSEEQKIQMGRESRKRAEKLLSPSVFIQKYVDLINRTVHN
jgi:glycosyltransferase involved in cell wall biosynthesis